MELLNELRNSLIERYKNKYIAYQEYVDNSFYDYTYNLFVNDYKSDSGINPEIYYGILFETELDKYLINKIKNGDLDLEILFIELHTRMINFICMKMDKEHKIKDKEGILIQAIDSYDGILPFSKYLVDVVKNELVNNFGRVKK